MTHAGPVLLIGAGRLGGALLEGWRRAEALDPAQLMLRVRTRNAAAQAAEAWGCALDPADARLAEARTVVLAVKPQAWRAVADVYAPLLAPDAVIVSLLVGTTLNEIAEGFGGRRTARVMPTTAVAVAQGTATLYAPDAEAMARAHALFDPVATTVEIADESLIYPATAVSGSAPAYLYAFIQALERAGVEAGLDRAAAVRLARATVTGSAAMLAETGADPADLIAQVASPGGTTQAALKVLQGEGGLPELMARAVEANIARARELAG